MSMMHEGSFRFIWGFIRDHLPMIALGTFMTCLYSVSVFLTPLASEFLIDKVLSAPADDLVQYGILLFILVCLAQPIFGIVKDLIFVLVAEDIVLDIRKRLFRKLITLKYRVYERSGVGDHLSRITNDVRLVSTFLTDLLAVILKDVLLIILVAYGMLIQSVTITLFIFVAFALFYLTNYLIARKLETLSKNSLTNYDRLCGAVSNAWENILLIKTNLLHGSAEKKFNAVAGETKKINLQIGKWNAGLNGISGMIMVLSLAMIYALGVLFIREGTMTLGSVVALGLYFQLLSTPATELNASIVQYKKTKPSFERLLSYLSEESEEEASLSSAPHDEQPSLCLLDVAFSYRLTPDSEPVLKDLSLSFSGPGLYAIRGKSGCGKSTLLKIALGLYDPARGSVTFDDYSGSAVDGRVFCSYVSQDAELLSGESLLYNLCLRDYDEEDIRRVHHLISCLQLEKTVQNLPEGLDAIIPEKDCFSGGERRRFALIRAIMSDKPILLLDEITTGLDDATALSVVHALQKASRSTLVIAVTHDCRVIDAAKQVIDFDALDA